MREEEFRQQVRGIARLYGWDMMYHTHDSRRSDGGWPDEVIAHRGRKRIIFVELKTDKGRVSRKQQDWLDTLSVMGLEAMVWRPRDIELIKRALSKENLSLWDAAWSQERPKVKPAPEQGWEFPERLTKHTGN